MGYSELYEYLRSLPDEELIEGWDWATDSEGERSLLRFLITRQGSSYPQGMLFKKGGLRKR